MSWSDDYEDGPERLTALFPAGVRAAGVIWIGFGVVAILGYLVSAAVRGGGLGGNPCGLGCGILFAIGFLVVGCRTVSGTARGTLGNGIGSLIFGMLYTAGTIGLVVNATSGRVPAGQRGAVLGGAAVAGLLAVSLLTAGMLAVAGRTAYAEWLAAHGRGGRRRRSAEEEDYDDRPRRRRDRDEEDER